ncbi:MAG: glutamine amidotransferase [Planctomycetota bacterium]|nr:glutamine amidotransferase [Planctomycetota bacterium]
MMSLVSNLSGYASLASLGVAPLASAWVSEKAGMTGGMTGGGTGGGAATLAALAIGPLNFERPAWLLLIPVLGALTIWIGRRSIAGLGSSSRWVTLVIRLLVITLLAGSLAEPHWNKTSKNVGVVVVLDTSRSVPLSQQSWADDLIARASTLNRETGDRLGVITVGRDAFVQSLPSSLNTRLERRHVGSLDATNLASGLQLALAVRQRDAAYRVLLVSDGLETDGSLLQAAEAARAAKVPVDILPLRFRHESEVVLDQLVAPPTAREGETISVKVLLQATKATRGKLSLLLNGAPVDLDPDSDGVSTPIELAAGPNTFTQQVTVPRSGPQAFKVVFEPAVGEGGRVMGDALTENNQSESVTFVGGDGRVLLVGESPDETDYLQRALEEAKFKVELRRGEQFPATLTEMNAFDAIVLVNQPAFQYSQAQQEELKRYVHDSGGGLVMVGGPNSFGAGGWIGSPLEDALPIRLDPPQKRQMPKGALVLVIHSVEIPEGVFWGKRVCEAAVNTLSRLDLVGINEFTGMGGTQWVYPLSARGDGTAVRRAIQNLSFGDMPDFAPSLELTYAALSKSDAGQKHCIIISDGDPNHPGASLLQKFVSSGITISTVGIATHGPGMVSNLQAISSATRGKHYQVAPGAVATLPQIFIKEAQTVKRSLIWEGLPFSPAPVVPTEAMRGVGLPVPSISGYIVAAEREGLALVALRGKEQDPILAQWQYGLGKTVTFTSDASSRWAASWVEWEQFKSFWEQHVRWAMRPSGSANVRVVTESDGDETVVTADILDSQGERLNFAVIRGRVARPDGTGQDVEMRQVAPGRYQGVLKTDQSGSYVMSFRYGAPGRGEGAAPIEGTILASVSRPFADEYRFLEDNTALLQQVRAMTNGRELKIEPQRAELFSREGLTYPVATTPIWLLVALAGLALFLADVGVRRVRIDPAMIGRAIKRAMQPGKAKTGEQMASLREAREKAKAKIAERAKGDGRGAGTTGGAAVSGESVVARGGGEPDLAMSRGRKFEASEAEIRKGATASVLGGAEAIEAEKERLASARRAAEQARTQSQGGEGMSRLLKAKQRAQEDMEETQ